MFGLHAPELLLILGIAIILFGAKRLPQLGRGIADAMRGVRKGFDDDDEPKGAGTT